MSTPIKASRRGACDMKLTATTTVQCESIVKSRIAHNKLLLRVGSEAHACDLAVCAGNFGSAAFCGGRLAPCERQRLPSVLDGVGVRFSPICRRPNTRVAAPALPRRSASMSASARRARGHAHVVCHGQRAY